MILACRAEKLVKDVAKGAVFILRVGVWFIRFEDQQAHAVVFVCLHGLCLRHGFRW